MKIEIKKQKALLKVGQIVTYSYGKGVYKVLSKRSDWYGAYSYTIANENETLVDCREKDVHDKKSKWFEVYR